LRGILAQSIRNVEIILVDSGSTDGTVAIAESFPVRVVKIDPKDFTFGYSLNQWFPDTMLAQQPHPFCNKANAAIRKYYGRIIQSTKRCLVWKTWIGLTA
jgi:glycosyltransferase involved in cell wall biosynthesis